jgi:hypothetical protein
MIEATAPLPRAARELSTRTEQRPASGQPDTQHEPKHQATGRAAQAAPPAASTAVQLQSSGLRLPALLVPRDPNASGLQSRGIPVELSLLSVGAGPAPPKGLVATVIGRTAERGLVLELAGHRLTIPPDAVDLPVGASLSLQLRLPGDARAITETSGLDRLIKALVTTAAEATRTASPGATTTAALVPNARLALRLQTDWHALAGRSPGTAALALERGNADSASSLELRVDGESGRSMLVDRDSGWRALFGLLGDTGQPLQAITLWRRERSRAASGESEEHLVLTLDLSRLGRLTLDLRTAPGRLGIAIASPEPLPPDLRQTIAEAFAAAAELAGLEPALSFRPCPAAHPGLAEIGRQHLADWIG